MKPFRIPAAITAIAAIAVLPVSAHAESEGEDLYKQHCKKCHRLDPGKHTLGPSLAGIVGQPAGQTDFKRYKALKGSDITWTDENLDAWIADPRGFIGKPTTMVVKIKDPADRAAIIEFLKQH